MSATEALRMAQESGVRLCLDGVDLVLRADREPPQQVMNGIRRHKAEIVTLLALHDYAGHRDLPEIRTLERQVVEWLNANLETSDPGICAECAECDRPEHVVVPFGTDGHGHTWLHPECWEAWHQRRRAMALDALLKELQA